MDTVAAFAMGEANRGRELKVFDWEAAARIIRDRQPTCAFAGLRQDWEWTAGQIYSNGEITPHEDTYTYLASTWATPTLSLDDGEEIDCWRMKSEVPGWNEGTYWPDEARKILTDPTS